MTTPEAESPPNEREGERSLWSMASDAERSMNGRGRWTREVFIQLWLAGANAARNVADEEQGALL